MAGGVWGLIWPLARRREQAVATQIHLLSSAARLRTQRHPDEAFEFRGRLLSKHLFSPPDPSCLINKILPRSLDALSAGSVSTSDSCKLCLKLISIPLPLPSSLANTQRELCHSPESKIQLLNEEQKRPFIFTRA